MASSWSKRTICIILLQQKTKVNFIKKVCENKDLPSEDTKILEFNQYINYGKARFTIYPYLESLTVKIDVYQNNPENSSTTKVSEHFPSGFSISTISSFKSIENKIDLYRGKDCMKKFCESLRQHTMKIINFKKKIKVINKRAVGITRKCKNLLYLQRKI